MKQQHCTHAVVAETGRCAHCYQQVAAGERHKARAADLAVVWAVELLLRLRGAR